MELAGVEVEVATILHTRAERLENSPDGDGVRAMRKAMGSVIMRTIRPVLV